MDVSYERLLNYQIPEVVQDLTPAVVAFYALSIGFGQDPLDKREIVFVDPTPAIVPVPSMALVLGYPGFWLGDDDVGVDAARIVHVQQEVILHSPLPTAGKISGKTRVTGLFNRGVNKGLVLLSERELLKADGQIFATLRQTHFLLGDQCHDAPSFETGKSINPPSGTEAVEVELPTRPEQALLYRLNGDMNRLHIDPALAKTAGFPGPILQGMCTFGIATRAVLAASCDYRPEHVRRISMRFRAPVFPGETLRAKIWSSGAIQVHSVDRDAVVIDAGLVTFGHAPDGNSESASSDGADT